MDSILTSIKKLLGIPEEYTQFDTDIIIHINSVMLNLKQIGIGPDDGFSITSSDDTWSSLYGRYKNLEAIKSYMFLKVRLLFDPPTSQAVMDAYKNQIAELEWRLSIEAESMTL